MDIKTIALQETTTEATLFMIFAENDLAKWALINGKYIEHVTLGKGEIKRISRDDTSGMLLCIQFLNDEAGRSRNFPIKTFEDGPFNTNGLFLQVPNWAKHRDDTIAQLIQIREQILEENKLALQKRIEEEKNKEIRQAEIEKARELRRLELQKEKESRRLEFERARELERIEYERVKELNRIEFEKVREQMKKEAAAREHFSALMEKYFVKVNIWPKPTSPLFMILLNFDSTNSLADEEIKWLERNKIFAPIAIYYENRMNSPVADLWDCVHAGSYWRKAGFPQKTLDITNVGLSTNNRFNAAIKTNRGAAFKDLKNYDQAKTLANEALIILPNDYHAFNLLGAIYFLLGDPEEGDRYFSLAVENGPIGMKIDQEIRNTIQLADKDSQKIVAQYLLKKDPVKYKWAEDYLKLSEQA